MDTYQEESSNDMSVEENFQPQTKKKLKFNLAQAKTFLISQNPHRKNKIPQLLEIEKFGLSPKETVSITYESNDRGLGIKKTYF